MTELLNRIALLELRAEQLSIHLQMLDPNCADAVRARKSLLGILHEMRACKEERKERLNSERAA